MSTKICAHCDSASMTSKSIVSVMDIHKCFYGGSWWLENLRGITSSSLLTRQMELFLDFLRLKRKGFRRTKLRHIIALPPTFLVQRKKTISTVIIHSCHFQSLNERSFFSCATENSDLLRPRPSHFCFLLRFHETRAGMRILINSSNKGRTFYSFSETRV